MYQCFDSKRTAFFVGSCVRWRKTRSIQTRLKKAVLYRTARAGPGKRVEGASSDLHAANARYDVNFMASFIISSFDFKHRTAYNISFLRHSFHGKT